MRTPAYIQAVKGYPRCWRKVWIVFREAGHVLHTAVPVEEQKQDNDQIDEIHNFISHQKDLKRTQITETERLPKATARFGNPL